MVQNNMLPECIEIIPCSVVNGEAPLYLYIIKNNNELTLIDSGVDDTPDHYIFPYLRNNGWTIENIKTIIITHAHHDHFGGNSKIYEQNPKVEFIVHKDDYEWVEDPQKHFNEMYYSYPNEWEPDEAYEKEVITS